MNLALRTASLRSQWSPQILETISTTNLRGISTTATLDKKRSGRFRVTIKHDKPLTYEEANRPDQIAHRKGWTTHNTC